VRCDGAVDAGRAAAAIVAVFPLNEVGRGAPSRSGADLHRACRM